VSCVKACPDQIGGRVSECQPAIKSLPPNKSGPPDIPIDLARRHRLLDEIVYSKIMVGKRYESQ